MTQPGRDAKPPLDKRDKTLMKAFTFAGAIVGVGLFGLARTLVLWLEAVGWLHEGHGVGPFYLWILGGAGGLFGLAWVLVKTRQRS